MRAERGFVLVNALILVAALAAAAVFVQSRARSGQAALGLDQEATQARLYLDGFEALAINVLTLDGQSGETDHPDDIWARKLGPLPVDRGELSGEISDLQGRFNLNWMASGEDTRSEEAFLRLTGRIGIAERLAKEIIGFVRVGGPQERAAYAELPVPTDPRMGYPLDVDDLRGVMGMRADDMARLRRYVTALPGNTPINLNTVSIEVLQGFFPPLAEGTLLTMLAGRNTKPILSVEAFFIEFRDRMRIEETEEEDLGRFSVGSDWFAATGHAKLGETEMSRVSVLQRRGLPRKVAVSYRLGRTQ